MNTLPKAVTTLFFNTSEDYQNVRAAYRAHTAKRRAQKTLDRHEEYYNDFNDKVAAGQNLLYLILMGKDWRKAYTAPTNANKVANHAKSNWGFHQAYRALTNSHYQAAILEPFKDFVKPGTIGIVEKIIGCQMKWYDLPAITDLASQYEAYNDEPVALLKSGAVGNVTN
jgi:hypothetical protein